MKPASKTIIGALSLSALALTASAQVVGEPSTAGTDPSEQEITPVQVQLPEGVLAEDGAFTPIGAAKVGDLIGMEVVDSQGEKLGSVGEIAVDVESGQVLGVILSTGGFLGIGASETAVPPGALVHNAEEMHLRLDAGKEQLGGAPPFDSSKWSEAFKTVRLTETYTHFGRESDLDFVDETGQPGARSTIAESRLDGVQRASEVVGTDTTNLQNEKIGEIEEILIDLSAGRLVALVVSTGEFLGIEGELSAIPATAFRFSTDRESLQFDTNKAALQAAPHFRPNRWPDFARADEIGAIYTAHNVEPYFLTGSATAPKASLEAARSSEHAPATQGESTEDMATSAEIRREIRALEDISPNARNVRVVTSKGHTTLSGPVDTAEEKEVIGEIANRVNRESNVENLLEVKAATSE